VAEGFSAGFAEAEGLSAGSEVAEGFSEDFSEGEVSLGFGAAGWPEDIRCSFIHRARSRRP
jgi:hypothetical protein